MFGLIAVTFFIVYALLVIIAGRFLHYSLRGITTKPPSIEELSGYDARDVQFEGLEGNKLQAWFVKSKSNPKNKTLVFVHGWNQTRSTLLPHIKLMVDSGYHVFAFDQRSHGCSETCRITFGPREAEDFAGAIKYLKSCSDVNMDCIGAFTESIGGSTVIYAASKYPEIKKVLKLIIIEGTWAKTTDILKFVLLNRFQLSLPFTLLFGYGVLAPGAFIWGLGKFNHSYPIDHIAKLKSIPFMFIRGENDQMVPEYSAMNMIHTAPDPKEVWILPDSKHLMAYQTHPEEYKRRVLSFLNTYM